MRDFLRSMLASLAALVLFVGGVLVFLAAVTFAVSTGKPAVTPRSVLILNLSTSFPDSVQDPNPAGLIQRAVGGSEVPALPLEGVLQALDRAARDASISALYLTGNVRSQGYASGPAALKELREAILRFKAQSGKPVIAYRPRLEPPGVLPVRRGLQALREPLRGSGRHRAVGGAHVLRRRPPKYGVQVQVTRVGSYKSAVEPYLLDRMSDANREQVSALLGDIWDDWNGAVAGDRNLTRGRPAGPVGPEGRAVRAGGPGRAGLVDRTATPDQVLDELKALSGRKASDLEFPQVDLETYMRMPVQDQGRNRIAVVYAEGEIVDGPGRLGQVGGDRVSRELRKLRLDPQVKAIVLRVNSPGGSAMASELIQREVILARKVKPVVVSMGYLAASGGYWIATYGERIFAEPNSITGSIGVFGLLPNVQKLANDHGITFDRVQTARLAGLDSVVRPKTQEELDRVQAEVDRTYDQFVDRVAASRHLTRAQVEAVAQGRVWSGRQALKVGLVDELGGIESAIRYAARQAKIEGDYHVDSPGEPRSTLERLLRLLGDSEERAYSQAGAGPLALLGDRLGQMLAAVQTLNDPRGVYARLPFDLNLR